MHHALEIQEILLNIFTHCRRPGTSWPREVADLPALARTCRAFKDPALDVLWGELYSTRPLVKCLPEASHGPHSWSFSRPLTQTEWDTLRSYTRRIRVILNFTTEYDWPFSSTFLNPPTAEPLFPNLRYLCCNRLTHTIPLLHLPLPSLFSLSLVFESKDAIHSFEDSLKSFPELAPNVRRLIIKVSGFGVVSNNSLCSYICRWRNLQEMSCPNISLDMDALMQLSCMPALTRLSFMLSDTLPDQIASSDSPLIFPNLGDLELCSQTTLAPISGLLLQTQLPLVRDLSVFLGRRPSKQDFSSFLAAVHTSGVGHVIQGLRIHSYRIGEEALLLGVEDLRPSMAFINLRRINLGIWRNVRLTDSELLELASAWPRLEQFTINVYSGWNTPGGITPNGLLRLLQTCRSLNQVALALDTRGYTELPSSQSLASFGLTLPCTFSINVLDSFIEEESVPAIAAFFAGIAPCSDFSFSAWASPGMEDCPDFEEYGYRWDNVYQQANHAVRQRS